MARFEKGKSGNPSGRPKKTQQEIDLAAACRLKTMFGFKRLIELCESENEAVAIRALSMLFDRGHGKPRQEIDMTTNQLPEPPVFNVIAFTDETGDVVTRCKPDGKGGLVRIDGTENDCD